MINWSPTAAQEVVQNVDTLLKTEPGSVPFARLLGVPQDVIDLPDSAVAARLQADAIKAVRTYEPRVGLKVSVKLAPDEDGKLIATATIGGP